MKKKIIIIVAAAVLVLGGVALFLFLPKPEPEPVITYYVPGEFFVTNIKDSTRLLKTTIVLELTTDQETEYLTEHNHIIRDIIVFELRQKTEEELRALDVNTTLRKEIVDELSKQMGLDYIQNIYFNDYVVQ